MARSVSDIIYRIEMEFQLSRTQLSDKLGVSGQVVSNWISRNKISKSGNRAIKKMFGDAYVQHDKSYADSTSEKQNLEEDPGKYVFPNDQERYKELLETRKKAEDQLEIIDLELHRIEQREDGSKKGYLTQIDELKKSDRRYPRRVKFDRG